jgi:aryl-alcohol dehydrogenase-like predicted oxidoreductase
MTEENKKISRREFIKKSLSGMAVLSGGYVLSKCTILENNELEETKEIRVKDKIPTRALGKTGLAVSILSFGGGSQFMMNEDGDWEILIERALNMGVNLFDTHSNYSGGESEIRFGKILPTFRNKIIVATKIDARTANEARSEFEGSLNRLRMDYVDILMIHGVEEADTLLNIDSLYSELVNIKEEGLTKYIGFSSMDSALRSREFIQELDFDVVLLAINPTQYGDFTSLVLPVALEKNIGVLAMKAMRDIVGVDATANELFSYALSQEGVSSVLIGHSDLNTLEENTQIAFAYSQDSGIAMRNTDLERRLKPLAGPHRLCWARSDYHDERIV